MKDLNFEELLKDYSPISGERGEKVKATLLRHDAEYGYLNINDKLEGRIRIDEIKDINIQDEFYVEILRKDEEFITVSKRTLERKEFVKELKKGDFIKGKIIKKEKNEYIVNIGLVNASLPFKYTNFSKEYIPNNEEFEFEIINKSSKNITLSRLPIIEKIENEFFSSHNLDDIVKGKVKNKIEHGYIIDVNSVSAFLHKSELNWNKESEKTLKIGEELEFKIIEFDKENKKVKLSLKQIYLNPWENIKNKYSIGQNFEATVKEILDFGVVVNLGADEGFIHVKDLYYKKTNNIKKEYSKGDIIFCEIISIDDEKERISLSARKVFDKFWENIEDIYSLNSVISVTVSKIKDFGIFVKTEDHLEIFVPKSEFSYKNEKMNFELGKTIDVKIIEINKEEKNIVASIKKMGVSPWDVANSKYSLNEIYEVSVTDILENGILVKLTDDFKGLILKKDLVEEVNVGDKISAVVFNKNKDKNSILLSVKKIKEMDEKKELKELMKIYGVQN